MAQYEGHRSKNAWNVALWMGNDEPTYRLAMDCIARSKTLGHAAVMFLGYVGENARTPDGARYNYTCVREALAGLKDG